MRFTPRRIAFTSIAVVVVAMILLSGCGQKPEPTPIADLKVAARLFISYLDDGQYGLAREMFSDQMKAAMSEAQLQATWEGVVTQVGAFETIYSVEVKQEQGYDAVYATCTFAQMALDVKVVFDDRGKVAGLWFLPASSGS